MLPPAVRIVRRTTELMGEELLQPTSQFVKAQGNNHHNLDWGNPTAPPLLLLHAVGLCASTWNRAARSLNADFHVMCFDQRGHGVGYFLFIGGQCRPVASGVQPGIVAHFVL